jgi:predicted small lipoprotein YifL
MLPTRALTLLAAIGLALTVSACGRRGALEAPVASAAPGPAAPGGATASPRQLPGSVGLGGGSATPDPDAVRAGDELSLSAVPAGGSEAPIETSRGAKRGYRVPKTPFILDPLL